IRPAPPGLLSIAAARLATSLAELAAAAVGIGATVRVGGGIERADLSRSTELWGRDIACTDAVLRPCCQRGHRLRELPWKGFLADRTGGALPIPEAPSRERARGLSNPRRR